jgi:hypothetical protein
MEAGSMPFNGVKDVFFNKLGFQPYFERNMIPSGPEE